MRTLSTILFLILILMLAACQPETPVALGPSAVPFPTMTIGQRVEGILTPGASRPLMNSLSNPATVEALGGRPTMTPDYSACPPTVANRPAPKLPIDGTLEQAVLDELNGGGEISGIEKALKA